MARAAFKWKPEYCDEIVTFMSGGKSATAFAGEIGVDPTTIYEWAKVYPDFAQCLAVGKAKRVNFWEGKAIDAAGEQPEGVRPGNPAVIIFTLKNAAPAEYSDRVTLAGDPNAPLQLVSDDLSLARAVAFLLQRAERAGRPAPLTIEGNSDGREHGEQPAAGGRHGDGPRLTSDLPGRAQ